MITQEQIQDVCRRIADEFHPDKIILFGSYAYGTPTEDSDVDVLVVMPFEEHPLTQAVKIATKLNPFFAIDLIVRTPEQIQSRLAQQDGFIRKILEEGKVQYETEYA